MEPLAEVATPALVVDADVLELNVGRMARLAERRGLALRPHAKTHKSPAIARLQVDAGAVGLTVATVAEAEVFAADGFDDLFVGYPLWVDPARGRRLRAVLDRAVVTVGVDSMEGARALAAQVPRGEDRLRVAVEVDSGQHRSGVRPADAGLLAEQVAHLGLRLAGVFTFPGHSYRPGGRADVAAEESGALAAAVRSLRERGLEPELVSGGSTPTADHEGAPLTEMRPGVYVFGDAQQWELGTAPADQLALTCLATVVSTVDGRVVLDAGSKVLGADRPPWASGHGRLLDHPDARVGLLSEHHAVVDWRGPLPHHGERVRVVPNHVCTAVNLVDELYLVRGGALVDILPVAARGANT